MTELNGTRTQMSAGTGAALQVGVLTVPVRVVPIQRDSRVSFSNLHAGECRGEVGHKNYCKACDKTLDSGEIIKGFTVSKGTYVPFTSEEVEAIKTAVSGFNVLGVADVSYGTSLVSATYLLLPDPKMGRKAYRLLREGLARTGKALVTTYTRSDTEHFAAVRPSGRVLVMDLLRFAEDVVDLNNIAPGDAPATDREVELASTLLERMASETSFDFASLRSSLKERLEAAVEAKLRGEEIAVPAEPKVAREQDLERLLEQAVAAPKASA